MSDEYERLEEDHQSLMSELTSYEEANNEIDSQMVIYHSINQFRNKSTRIWRN